MNRPTPRPGLLSISPYVPGKAKAAGSTVYKLSSNESALGPAPSAVRALREVAADAHRYPDSAGGGLRQKLAGLHGLEADRIVIGNGSDELLSLMVRSYTSPGHEVLMTRHGFSYYPLAALAEACVPVMAEERDLTADVDALLSKVSKRTKILFLANPNNPTGTRLPDGELRRLREDLPPEVMLVLDGAYAEYVDSDDYDGGIALVREAVEGGRDNVVMTRTFSKIYGLGGLRIGWLYGPPSVVDILNRVRGPFNVSAPALAAAEAALGDESFVTENRRHNAAEMERLTGRLAAMGLAVMPTEANFVLIEFGDGDEAQDFLAHCEAAGVLIRGLASSNLPEHVRVSIGSTEANDAFLSAAERFERQS